MQGLDEIGLTLAMAGDIAQYEQAMAQERPWLAG